MDTDQDLIHEFIYETRGVLYTKDEPMYNGSGSSPYYDDSLDVVGRTELARYRHLRGNYNMSLGEYDDMVDAQNGKCKICGSMPTTKPLSVDHDHETGEIRGLLCNHCNTMLGFARDNTAVLRSGAEYLLNYRKKMIKSKEKC
jgi:hypothetical protein